MSSKRETIEILAKLVAEHLGKPWGHYREENDGLIHAVTGGWAIDYNKYYGGYEIQEISSKTGGTIVIGGGRKTAGEMIAFLNGMLVMVRLETDIRIRETP